MPKQILIVDDSPMIRRLVRTSLEANADWQVCGEAENGEVAIPLVNELRPDLVILDLVMPGMDGLEAARQIKTIAPKTPMLLFTMQHSAQLEADARAAGIHQVLSKSDSGTEILISSIRNLLSPPDLRTAQSS